MDYFDTYYASNDDSSATMDYAVPNYESETLVNGDNSSNTYPVISDDLQSSSNTSFSGVQNLLGSVGSVVTNLPKIGTSLGTVVGTAKHDVNQGIANYNNAQSAASKGNNLSTWWQFASTTDKIMIGLAVIAIVIAVREK